MNVDLPHPWGENRKGKGGKMRLKTQKRISDSGTLNRPSKTGVSG